VTASAGAGGLIGPHLQAFFAEHLLAHKRASPQTIACYRDTFRLLLRFMRDRTGAEPAALPLAALDADAVLAFLDHIERDRGCSVRSRNNRLAAIRSFFRLVALRVPAAARSLRPPSAEPAPHRVRSCPCSCTGWQDGLGAGWHRAPSPPPSPS